MRWGQSSERLPVALPGESFLVQSLNHNSLGMGGGLFRVDKYNRLFGRRWA